MFAMDEQPPAALVVVSAEEGLANGLNKLVQRGYRVVIIRPPRAALSAALQGTAEAVLEWREVTGDEDEGSGDEDEGAGGAGTEAAAAAPQAAPPGPPGAAAGEGGVSLEGVLNQLLQDQESKGGHGISDIPPDVVPVSSFYSYFTRTAPAARVDLQAAARAGVVELGGQRPKEWVRLCRGAIKPPPSLRPRKGPIPFFSGDASQIDWL